MKYICFVSFFLILLLNNDKLCLWEQDEAAYAGFGYQMLETSNYAIPDFEWSWPHRKPPLHFWLIAVSYSLFGCNEFATRIPSVLAILSSLGLLYFFVKRLYSKAMALWVSYVFMASLLVPVYGKISMTDATLLMSFIGSYFSIIAYIRSSSTAWLVSLFLFVTLGGLTKGPPIYLTTFGSLGLAFLLDQRRRVFFTLLTVGVAGLIPFGIWAWYTYSVDGGVFFNWWVDWYILKRTTGTIYGQTGWPGYYILIFIVCFFSWILFLPEAMKRMTKDFLSKGKTSEEWFQFGWIIFGWLFYEILKSKLPSYAFAVIPIWCLYIAKVISDHMEDKTYPSLFSIRILGGLYCLIGLVLFVVKDWIPFEGVELPIYVLTVFLIGMGLLYLIYARGRLPFQLSLPALALCFSFGLHIIAWGIAIPAFEPIRSFPQQIAEKLDKLPQPSRHVFFSCDYSMSSLPVYLAWKGWTYTTAKREDYERNTLDSFMHSKTEVFMLQRRNLHYLQDIEDSFKITPIYGWISDRGVVDTFFIAERKGIKSPSL